MYIEKASLSNQEKNIVNLLEANTNMSIYDFRLDETVKSIQVNTYELVDGTWHLLGEGSYMFADNKGRIALEFENTSYDLKVSVQNESGISTSKHYSETKKKFNNMESTMLMLNELKPLTYEKEIPLIIHISASSNSATLHDVDYFPDLEDYKKYNYEYIYAITICFSQN